MGFDQFLIRSTKKEQNRQESPKPCIAWQGLVPFSTRPFGQDLGTGEITGFLLVNPSPVFRGWLGFCTRLPGNEFRKSKAEEVSLPPPFPSPARSAGDAFASYFRRAFLLPLLLALRLDLPRVFAFAFAFERAMAIANYLLSSVSMPARRSDRIVSGNDAPHRETPRAPHS